MEISRRTLLAAAAIPLTGVGAACAARTAERFYIRPGGEGDGSSWDEAASLGAIGELIAQLIPGGEILIAADAGAYEINDAIEISAGGRVDKPIRVHGVASETGEPSPVAIRGVSTDDEPPEAFRLLRGADHLHFSHFAFAHIGNGCFRVGAPISNLTIEDCSFADVYRFFENGVSRGQRDASIRGFAIRRCQGEGVERGFLRVRYGSRDGVIEDCRAVGRANEGGNIPAGCALDDRASAITFRRCVMENFQQWRAGEYWNGDGFSDEENNSAIRYEACEARGSTDGGFDCKSRNVVFENCIAEDNKRNFRIWSARGAMRGCVSRNPNFRGRGQENADSCHIWIGGENARVAIDQLIVEDQDGTAVFGFEHDSALAEVRGIELRSPSRNWGASVRESEGVLTARQD
jgi:hypothetical protein